MQKKKDQNKAKRGVKTTGRRFGTKKRNRTKHGGDLGKGKRNEGWDGDIVNGPEYILSRGKKKVQAGR